MAQMVKKRRNVRERILSVIINYTEKHDGRSPTYREIGDEAGIDSLGHIAYHLKSLEEKGYIQRDGKKSRSIKVLKYWDGSSMTSPVAAGPKRTIMNVIEKDVQLFANKAFLLPVEGNSMVGDSIFDGDLIIVDPEKQIEDGDIVVATHLNVAGSELGAATVKRFYHDGKSIRLQPSNPAMEPIFVDGKDWDREWKVQGKVRAVIHQFY
jgi:repressor LexA